MFIILIVNYKIWDECQIIIVNVCFTFESLVLNLIYSKQLNLLYFIRRNLSQNRRNLSKFNPIASLTHRDL